jgi:hypothetical protein
MIKKKEVSILGTACERIKRKKQPFLDAKWSFFQ